MLVVRAHGRTDADDSAPRLARSGQAAFGNLVAALTDIAVSMDELNALDDLTIGDITIEGCAVAACNGIDVTVGVACRVPRCHACGRSTNTRTTTHCAHASNGRRARRDHGGAAIAPSVGSTGR